MITAFAIFSLLSFISFLVLIILTYKRHPDILGSWKFTLTMTLYMVATVSSVYFVLTELINGSKDYRPFITILTVIIAFISFATSVFLANRTTSINKENQKTSFVMDLIKNNAQVLKEKESEINHFIKALDHHFKSNRIAMDKILPLAEKYFQQKDREINASLIELKKGGSFKNDIQSIESALRGKHHDIFKILITYFEIREPHSHFFNSLDEASRNRTLTSNFHKILTDESNFLDILSHFIHNPEVQRIMQTSFHTLTYEEIKPIMEGQFEHSYNQLGHFFRNSYRVVKTINSFSQDDLEFKKTFLGILRSYYSENVLIAIYYNSIFTEKGLGYARELALSDFFGDKQDLENDQPIHFRKENLYFNEKDLRTIKKIFISESPDAKEIKKNEVDLKKLIQQTFDRA